MESIQDKFSGQAKQYQKFRPHYPEMLYNFLYRKLKNFESAWDCGTGNGQVASRLAEKFQRVYATDISEKQLKEAALRENVKYSIGRAEETGFEDNSFDLITVAQAIHWFDLDAFYKEVRRVAKPDAILAVWGYDLLRLSPDIDQVIDTFYHDTLGSYWDTPRKLIEDEYKTVSFPFKELEAPKFEIAGHWDFEQLLGYFNSWSAVQNYIEANGKNPVDVLENDLKPFWKDKEVKQIHFRVFLRIGTVEK